MLAGPGLPGNEVTRQQAADGARAMGATEEQIATIVAQHRALTDAVRSDSGVDVLTRAVQNLVGAQYDGLPAAQRTALGARADFIEKTYRPHVGQLSTPWMKFFMTYDPAIALAGVKAPVLAMFGQLDTQVPPSLNEPPVRQALSGNSLATIKVYPQANHLFQRATTGQVTEYGILEKAFVPSLLPDVSTWILSIARR
jgi:pimeloyl-ACP methyl ester carboxylesterase